MGRNSYNYWAKRDQKVTNQVLKSFFRGSRSAIKAGAVVMAEASKSLKQKAPGANLYSPPVQHQHISKWVFLPFVGAIVLPIALYLLFDVPLLAVIVIGFIFFLVTGSMVSNSESPRNTAASNLPAGPLLTPDQQDAVQLVKNSLVGEGSFEPVLERISGYQPGVQKEILVRGFESSVEMLLNDGVLTLEEEERIAGFQTFFDISKQELNRRGYFEKAVRASVIRSVLNGFIPEGKLNITGALPFNLQRGETIVWLFQGVNYFEQRDNRTYIGGSDGFSMRIANGLYYRTGVFKGHSVVTTDLQYISSGILAFTNKHVYFASPEKSFRILYDKVVAYQRYEDGLGLQKDGNSSRPQIFTNIDGWFAYNLAINITKLDQAPHLFVPEKVMSQNAVRVTVKTLEKYIEDSVIDDETFSQTQNALLAGEKYVLVSKEKLQGFEEKRLEFKKEEQRMQKCVERNNQGMLLEKQGKEERAIKLYEANIAEGYPATHSFKRLGILYRKSKNYENEKRVLRRYYEVFNLDKNELEQQLKKIDLKANGAKEAYRVDYPVDPVSVPERKKPTLGQKRNEIIAQMRPFNFYVDMPEGMTTSDYLMLNKALIAGASGNEANHLDSKLNTERLSIERQFRDAFERAERLEKSGDFKSAARIYEEQIANDCFVPKPWERLIAIYSKAKLQQQEKRILESGIKFFSEVKEKQQQNVLLLARKAGKEDFAQKRVQEQKKIFYYGGAFELYNPYPVIDKWKERLAKLKASPTLS